MEPAREAVRRAASYVPERGVGDGEGGIVRRVAWLVLLMALVACSGAPVASPTSTAAPPTATSAPAAVAAQAADTPAAPTAAQASMPPTNTPSPPTATPAPPTATPVPPTATPVPPTPTATPIPREAVTVVSVTDGDTIRVRFADGRVEPVRYIGVDTPETVDPRTTVECFGQAASAKNAELVGGRTVYLEKDVSERDKYDRLLRYIWVVGDDGVTRMANEELVKWGFAAASAYPPDVRYRQRFADLQRAAQQQHLGLWGVCKSGHDPLPTATRVPPTPTPTTAPAPAAPPASRDGCDPSYPTVCIPPYPPDLDCKDIPYRRFKVVPPDPHRFDGDHDGIGCE